LFKTLLVNFEKWDKLTPDEIEVREYLRNEIVSEHEK